MRFEVNLGDLTKHY